MVKVDASGLNRAEVLKELYDNATPDFGGLSFLVEKKPLSLEEARSKLQSTSYFDYLNDVSMKICFSNKDDSDDSDDPECTEYYVSSNTYDKDYGSGSLEKCIQNVRDRNEY